MKAAPTHGWHPASRFLDLELDEDGKPTRLRAHVVDVGPRDGPHPMTPTIVLLHGIAVSSWAWRKNIDVLARDFRVIAICHKGHGWSGRDDGAHDLPALSRFVCAALDQLGVARAHWVGNSLGGSVALWTAVHRPERVDRLVLVNAAAHGRQFPWPFLSTQVAALAPVYRALLGPTLLRIPLALIAYRGLPIDRDYMAGFWAPFAVAGSMRALVATARALPRDIAALERRLPEIGNATMVIWGEADALLPSASAHRLVRALPAARLVLFPGCGHCPQEEAPERFNALVRAFLQG